MWLRVAVPEPLGLLPLAVSGVSISAASGILTADEVAEDFGA